MPRFISSRFFLSILIWETALLKTVYSQLTKMQLGVERVDIADSAVQARECMERHRYDIFLCDIVMPEERCQVL